MMRRGLSEHIRFSLLFWTIALPLSGATATELRYPPLPYPVVDDETWVLVEIWPEVSDITLSAYFMDRSGRKNQNLCEATKRSLDRDAMALAKEQKRQPTASRQCLTVTDAISAGYIEQR